MGRAWISAQACIAALGLTACETEQFFSALPSASLPGQALVEAGTAHGVVCDPLGGGQPASASLGLKGDLYYAGPTNEFRTTLDFFTYGIRSDLKLYLNQVNVPTRSFSSGFVTTENQFLLDPQGNLLIENFALHLESELALADGDAEGQYQLALLADDGARLRVFDLQSGGEEIINIDGVHPTKLGCPSRSVQMTRGHPVPIQISYFQGPRYHISLMLMWRVTPPNTGEALCNASGNDLFFNSNVTPSAPKQAYEQLLSRGWQVVRPQNFLMPGEEKNPCAH